jgi:hypothetical protein
VRPELVQALDRLRTACFREFTATAESPEVALITQPEGHRARVTLDPETNCAEYTPIFPGDEGQKQVDPRGQFFGKYTESGGWFLLPAQPASTERRLDPGNPDNIFTGLFRRSR